MMIHGNTYIDHEKDIKELQERIEQLEEIHKKLKDNQRMMTKAIFDLHKRVEKSENKNSIIISGR